MCYDRYSFRGFTGYPMTFAVQRASRLSRRAEFRCGGTRLLFHLASASFDSGILFNIMDNLLPEDALRAVGEFHRLVEHHGRILLKLNDLWNLPS